MKFDMEVSGLIAFLVYFLLSSSLVLAGDPLPGYAAKHVYLRRYALQRRVPKGPDPVEPPPTPSVFNSKRFDELSPSPAPSVFDLKRFNKPYYPDSPGRTPSGFSSKRFDELHYPGSPSPSPSVLSSERFRIVRIPRKCIDPMECDFYPYPPLKK